MTDRQSFATGLLGALGLCPLLALSVDVRSGFALGIATLLVAMIAGAATLLLRRFMNDALRWPVLALLVAIATGLLGLGMRTVAYDSYIATENGLPLLVSNSILLSGLAASATAIGNYNALRNIAITGLAMTLILFFVGALREGLPADTLGVTALFAAGLVLAAKNYWQDRHQPLADTGDHSQPPGARRVRVTGPVR